MKAVWAMAKIGDTSCYEWTPIAYSLPFLKSMAGSEGKGYFYMVKSPFPSVLRPFLKGGF
jgi:hypothetical protein